MTTGAGPSGDSCLLDQEPLSEQHIQQLLAEAEQRLDTTQAKASKGRADLRFPKLQTGVVSRLYVVSNGAITRVDSGRLIRHGEKEHSSTPRRVEDPVVIKETMKKQKKATAGSDWFNLPRTNLTPEFKRDLQLLQMRSVLDPKRHYKKENKTARAPEFSQVGTILEGPTEFYSARLLQKDRKNTLLEEVLAGEKTSGRFKSKYNDIQAAKTNGKKAHYRELKSKRSKRIRKP